LQGAKQKKIGSCKKKFEPFGEGRREKERQHVAQRSEGVLRHSINELLRDLTEELAVKQPDQPIEMLSLQKSI
jgi:hypothetical protein